MDHLPYILAAYGLTATQRFGANAFLTPAGVLNGFDHKSQQLKDVEVAAFGEGNYWLIPEKLKATAGVRVSRVTFDYAQQFYGPINGFLLPTTANGGLADYDVVGSKGGAPTDPFWVQNLRSDPQVKLYIRRKPRRATARIAEGEERARYWQHLTQTVSSYREYEKITDRQIPVVILDEHYRG